MCVRFYPVFVYMTPGRKGFDMIESCSFGAMTVDGRRYTSDLMIFADGRVADQWWRAEGHRLSLKDMMPLIESAPRMIVAGMGIYGRMKADSGLEEALKAKGIILVTENSEAAARRFNDLCKEQTGVAACFHLTC